MNLTFLGAAHEVTGSCTYLEACGKKILIDYGMEQGADLYENAPLPVLPREVDYVLLTHAHIDHSGLLPLLYKNNFAGKVHATVTTAHLCDIMLRDSAHIQMFEAEWQNRKRQRKGEKPVEPLYNMNDAAGILAQFSEHPYDTKEALCPGIDIRFTDAGHLLGSSSIELWISEDGVEKKIAFSGDVGNINQPLLRDPQFIDTADYVVIESTYGNRKHNPPENYVTSLAQVLQRTFDRGGNVVIPSFAVGRTQEMLYFIREIKQRGLVKGHDGFPVYVDSPLAIEATKVFVRNAAFCYDEEASTLLAQGVNPLQFDGLTTASTPDESIAINTDPIPKVILSASGMCEAGRIKHHLKHNLWRPESTVLFVGYQANGTIGRSLVDGARQVKLFGEEIEVNAEILQLPGVSGHGDMEELSSWIVHLSPKPTRVFVNHGEDAVCDEFAKHLQDTFGIDSYAPYSGTKFDLAQNKLLYEAAPKRLAEQIRTPLSIGQTAGKSAYGKLILAVERLVELMNHSRGRANADLEKLSRKINDLCSDWEK